MYYPVLFSSGIKVIARLFVAVINPAFVCFYTICIYIMFFLLRILGEVTKV